MIFGFQDDFRSKLLVCFLASNLHKWVTAGVLTFDIFEINENKYILTTAFPCLHGSFFATLFKAFGFHFALRLCTSCWRVYFSLKGQSFPENLALPIQFDGIIPISSEAAWLLQEMLELLIYSFGTIYKLNSAMNPQTITDIFLNKLVIDELHETGP